MTGSIESGTLSSADVRILAIGTELTDGQVLEKNAAWLSIGMTELGFRVIEHRTIPDDRASVEACLREWINGTGGLIVTGGLGPTSDDFTRECLAKIFARPLVLHESSWTRIQERLAARGVPVTPNQKSQAMFPKGSEILRNESGTAHGFWLDAAAGSPWVAVLPGPPSEIASIWRDGLRHRLEAIGEPHRNKRTLVAFKTLGRGEGAIAAETEEILDELQSDPKTSRIEVGYRANIPYVEIKFWLTPETIALKPALQKKVHERFGASIVGPGEFDFVDEILAQLREPNGSKVCVDDSVTGGLFFDRIRDRAAKTHQLSQIERLDYRVASVSREFDQPIPPKTYLIRLTTGDSNTQFRLEQKTIESTQIEDVTLPSLAIDLSHDRGRRWATELAFQRISDRIARLKRKGS